MRILKVSHHYPAYLQQLSDKLLPFTGNYQAMLDAIMADGFSWADFYTDAFQDLGHEAIELIHNFTPLQELYAKEHGLTETGLALLTKQVQTIKPDILFLDTLNVPREWVREIRKVPSIQKIAIFNCSPASSSAVELFKECDLVITCNQFIHRQYLAMGLKSFHVFHGFGEKVLKKLRGQEAKPQILFSGSLFPGADFHDERTKVLEGFIQQNLPLVVYAYLNSTPDWKLFMKQQAYLAAKVSAKIPGNPLAKWSQFRNLQDHKSAPAKLIISKSLRSKLHAPLFGIEMYQAMKDSLITFNIHGGIAGPFAANMRLFEATGVGSCLLTDKKDDLKDLFDLDKEVVTYTSKEDCIEKATWLLNNPLKAKEIAIAGQARTLKDHSYKQRAKQLIKIFELN